jgi:ADP-ribose pyrophosphatase
MAVFSDHIVSGGLEVQDFLVVAPHTTRPDLITGIAVIPIRDDSILLLHVYRHCVGHDVWELPRGFIDVGEDPATAALRELEEETGLVCPPEKLLDLGPCYPEPGILRAQVALFAATACRPEGAILNDEIGLGPRAWYTRARVREMLRDGGIIEGSTSLALYRYFAL